MSQTWVHGVFRLSACWYVKQGEWWAGKKMFMFLHSIHQISLLWWFSPSVCGRLLPAEVVQKKKKFQISSLSRLDSRVWHQNTSSLLASGAVFPKHIPPWQAPWTSSSWVTPTSRRYLPIATITSPHLFLSRNPTSP